MFKFDVYIETDEFVLAIIIYAKTYSQARINAIKKFNKTFKHKKIYSVHIRKDYWWFGGYEH